MNSLEPLRQIGLLDARVPRYTSYPPANHFAGGVTGQTVSGWMAAVPTDHPVSLYVHVPYCRNLCWFCACRTQGTSTNRPLRGYLDLVLEELARVSERLPAGVTLGHIHLGGGTPTILPPDLLSELCDALHGLRPWARDAEFSVEIDPTEIDEARLAVLAGAGMTRASIGVQDFDPEVQAAIGRHQPYDLTRDVVGMIRAAGVRSLNMDVLYGLPHQSRARLAGSIQRVMALEPDRVALFGYAHVPWMAKRQQLIPTEALPGPETRLDLFDTARHLLVYDGYRMIGIDHFARPGDSLAQAAVAGRLRRNFQGYTDDTSTTLVGVGASAISRYAEGYAQNQPTSAAYAKAIGEEGLAIARGHAFTEEDRLRGAMIEEIMCRFEVDIARLATDLGVPAARLERLAAPVAERFPDHVSVTTGRLRILRDEVLVARLVANALDAYVMPEGAHSRAL
ncbi:oxygen-independent coproporphyrinogen III oxidase [Histidinibacterium aquaticum]|uniref:Coproporphyrinogen-III oxidase n=1 Tax=Histidinibacterium aquaticum TaxID=2613962 RepID=A0A5J5GE54_9RHOB|nr:oxygen-independent coproporphyrinogen III oxidase [Histidinibacterium aquaticum]KAA9006072.1 oxygen-independent coproporphyrinogen III oxidase [Histidinibacterium aquaticum]